VKQPKRQPALGLHVANAFEIGGRLDTRKDDLVCVPSLKNP